MTTTEQVRANPEAPVCRRCHGTGLEPMPEAPTGPEFTAEQQAVLDQLAEQGRIRKLANRHTLDGRRALDEAYREIQVLVAEGTRLGLQRIHMTEAVGVSKAAFYAIVAGKVGTS